MKIHLPKPAVIALLACLVCTNCEEIEYTYITEKTYIRTFGGIDNERGFSIQQTSDGGYIIAGDTRSYSAGYVDAWLIKTDASGNLVWSKTLGGDEPDYGRDVQQTSDNGYIISGYTHSFGVEGRDVWLTKTDVAGDIIWTKTFGGSDTDAGFATQQTSDGGYIITGDTRSYGAGGRDIWLIRTDALGDTIWTKTIGGISTDRAYSVQQTSDGGYIITGLTDSFSNYFDLWIIKTDASGNIVWDKTFGGSREDCGLSVQQTSDMGYIVTGYTGSYGSGQSDVWLIKINAFGDSAWAKTFGGTDYDGGKSVQQTSDGGYILTGFIDSNDSECLGNLWLIKTDAYGDTLWTRIFGGSDSEWGSSVKQTSDGGYIITGYTGPCNDQENGDVWLIKTDEYGNVE